MQNQGLILIKDLGVQFATENSKNKRRFGMYLCSCGVEFKACTAAVKSGHTKSCGCYSKKVTVERSTKHGLRYHRLYDVWKSMIHRTSNPNSHYFEYYGARGISVCKRWQHIVNFIEDMYPTFKEGLTIDRINNDGNYEPSNCRWATRNVQQRNTRKIHINNNSGYRGVSWSESNKKWVANIVVNSKPVYVGSFDSAIEAAKAYDNYVIKNNLEHTKNEVK